MENLNIETKKFTKNGEPEFNHDYDYALLTPINDDIMNIVYFNISDSQEIIDLNKNNVLFKNDKTVLFCLNNEAETYSQEIIKKIKCLVAISKK